MFENPNNKKRLSVCPLCVRYRFLRNRLTEFDETLHALVTLPDDVKNAKKKIRFREKNFHEKKNFQKFFGFFRIFTNNFPVKKVCQKVRLSKSW